MTDLDPKRPTAVRVLNSDWLTNAQLTEALNAFDDRIKSYFDKKPAVIPEPALKTVSKKIASAGDYIEINHGHRSCLTLAIDGDGEEFEANFVVLYQAREGGEFIRTLMVSQDNAVVSETPSQSAFYKIIAPAGQTIRVVAKYYKSGTISAVLIAGEN